MIVGVVQHSYHRSILLTSDLSSHIYILFVGRGNVFSNSYNRTYDYSFVCTVAA